MPDTTLTRVISDRFSAWAASLPEDDQATLAGWMGLDDDGWPDDARVAREEVGRRLIEKLRRFVTEDLTPDEGAMFGALMAPALELMLPGSAGQLASTPDDVLPRGVSAVLPAALVERLQSGDFGDSDKPGRGDSARRPDAGA